MSDITRIDLIQDAQTADRAAAMIERAAETDGIEPISEQFINGLRDARLGHKHWICREDDRVVGLAAFDGDSAELVVDPPRRRQGIGKRLIRTLREEAGQQVPLWAHGNLPPAQALANSLGLRVQRRLLVMEVAGERLVEAAQLTDAPMTGLALPEATQRWGEEYVYEQWLRVNNEAFSWHPEQGGWDLPRLRRGMEAPWFDAQDVWLLWDEAAAGKAQLAGFHWTKWHGEADQGEAIGEVYVVGLATDYRGRGLGTPLLHLGLRGLREKGADKVILYVESDNSAAVRAYEKLGFAVAEEHCQWA